MTVQHLSAEPAFVVQASDATTIDVPHVIGLLEQHGIVLFEGLSLDVEQFEAFTNRFGRSDREYHPSLHGKSRDVLSGRSVQALHREFFAVPCIAPDLVWFYCQQRAASGGRTTFADGVQFRAEMSPAARDLFEHKRLCYHVTLSKAIWEQAFPGGEQTLQAFAAQYPELRYRISGEGVLNLVCVSSAYATSRFAKQPAFVNPVMHALQYPHYYRLSLDDGQSLPPDIVAELHVVSERVTRAIRWKPGDFAMIDNARVMHGREAFADPARRIFARHAMAVC